MADSPKSVWLVVTFTIVLLSLCAKDSMVPPSSQPSSSSPSSSSSTTTTRREEADTMTSLTSQAQRSVVIVGGGLAGASAAIEAARAGAQVTILDKEAKLRGNSAKASSGINGVDTPAQKALNIADSPQTFYRDTISSGRGKCNPELAGILTEESTEAFSFLESFPKLNLSDVTQCGGHSRRRTHRVPSIDKPQNVGFAIMSTLEHEIVNADRITMITGARVQELITTEDKSAVKGVVFEQNGRETRLLADAVILTTGGYGRSPQLLKEFVPNFQALPSTNGPFTTGDGITLGRSVDADLVGMGDVQVHPTGLVDPANPKDGSKWLAPEALRGSGGILLNHRGERFVNELGRRDEVSNAIFDTCRANAAAERFGTILLSSYIRFKKVTVCDNAEDCAQKLNFDKATLLQTISLYNNAVGTKNDPFGLTVFPSGLIDENDTLYAFTVTPVIHYTMGGLRIDSSTAVLKQNGAIIRNLFAAGEVTGGVHGANRLAGNSLLECVVFGRRAGRSAALGTTSSNHWIAQTNFTAILAAVGVFCVVEMLLAAFVFPTESYYAYRFPDIYSESLDTGAKEWMAMIESSSFVFPFLRELALNFVHMFAIFHVMQWTKMTSPLSGASAGATLGIVAALPLIVARQTASVHSRDDSFFVSVTLWLLRSIVGGLVMAFSLERGW